MSEMSVLTENTCMQLRRYIRQGSANDVPERLLQNCLSPWLAHWLVNFFVEYL